MIVRRAPPGLLLAGALLGLAPLVARAGNAPASVSQQPAAHNGEEPRAVAEQPRDPTPPDRLRSPWADERRELRALQVAKGPAVDGRLDEPCWRQAENGGPLVQFLPYEGVEPSCRTEFWVVYDREALYIGVACHDPHPENIVAFEMAHDGKITSDDHIIVVIDTFLDRRNGYEFRVNPNGARAESLISDNVNLNDSWDTIWTAAATVDAEGWKTEIAIPFKSLSFKPGLETWGFNLLRNLKSRNERDRWVAARPEINTYNVAEAGTLTGLKGLEQGLGLELIPYALGRYRYENADSDQDLTAEVGGDLRYRVTPNLTASLSYNTDFAETEVDARQVNLSRFPLFFPEKRAFFLEDSGIFSFGGLSSSSLLPFFSRRIGLSAGGEVVPILTAGKLTGRVGGFNLGAIDAVLDRHDGLGPKNAFVGRISRNVLEQSSVGILGTAGDPDSDDNNLTLGADVGYRTSRLFGDNVLQGNAFVLGSFAEGQSGHSNKSFGGSLSLPNDLYGASLQFFQVDDQFRPALGFVPRTGVRAYTSSFSYRPRPTGVDWLRQMYFTYSNSHYTDLSDRLDTASHSFYPVYLVLESGDTIYASASEQLDSPDEPFEISPGVVIPPGDYWWPYFRTGIDSASKRAVELELDVGVGDFYDGSRQSYTGALDLKPSRHLTFRVAYSLNRVFLPQGDFDTRVASLRVQTSFTPDLVWHNFLQYDNVSRLVGWQSRLVWEASPGTRLYLVLNQSIDREGADLQWIQTDFTAKLGVTFRF